MQMPSKRLRGARDLTSTKPVLITGGAGFIGSNMAHRLLSLGHEVLIYDNLSRPGVEHNLRWILRKFGEKARFVRDDTRNASALAQAVQGASAVFHFAAQVAVTTSLIDPALDFDVNARGTLNLLEALRSLEHPPPLLYTSTNKVYGDLAGIPLEERARRWTPKDEETRGRGIDELRALDFHSPYGCSKGAADQYVLDYAKSFGLSAVVFRMSCIYGPRQFGTEDQGWVAHFLIRAVRELPITIFGDGKQVRDLLFVEDLLSAMLIAMGNMERFSGHAFNMGGGPRNTVSLLELVDGIGELTGKRPRLQHEPARVGDQRYYVSNVERFQSLAHWQPTTTCQRGIAVLHDWLCGHERYLRARPSTADRTSVMS